jgi:hypothetical protein
MLMSNPYRAEREVSYMPAIMKPVAKPKRELDAAKFGNRAALGMFQSSFRNKTSMAVGGLLSQMNQARQNAMLGMASKTPLGMRKN